MADEKSDDTTETGHEPRPEEESSRAKSTKTKASKDTRSASVKTVKTRGRSGNPAKPVDSVKSSRFSRREKDDLRALDDPISSRHWRSPRFLIGTAISLAGIAWIAYYYIVVRPEPGAEPGGPAFMGDLERWNYAIGFGAILLGLIVNAHRSTPLGRGRGVVVGMLGCFLIGLLWICTFYVITDDISRLPVFNDLGQFNLVVGIAFMAVGFAYATKWE